MQPVRGLAEICLTCHWQPAGAPSYNFRADAAAQGTLTEKVIQNGQPIRGITTNTAVTVVCPATPSVIWRATASYRVGA